MIYVIADIHGCYQEYQELLQKIDFSESDELYVLGDVLDRGPEPIKVLQDMMGRFNVYPILGNHEYMALSVLKKLNVEIREDNYDSHLSDKDIQSMLHWQSDGGDTTMKAFSKLDAWGKEDILDYLQEFSLYEEVYVNGMRYVLVHADLHNFSLDKKLETYDLKDLLFYRADYECDYFADGKTILVTGHTPTFSIREDGEALIYEKHGHLALDCGCVYGKRLAAYCLDTQEVFYVDKR